MQEPETKVVFEAVDDASFKMAPPNITVLTPVSYSGGPRFHFSSGN
jgi:hypothetical protein